MVRGIKTDALQSAIVLTPMSGTVEIIGPVYLADDLDVNITVRIMNLGSQDMVRFYLHGSRCVRIKEAGLINVHGVASLPAR